MITAVPIIIGGLIVKILTLILSVFNFIIPVQVQSALTWIFHFPWYFQGVLPVSDIMLAFSIYLTAWLLVYGVKLGIMGLNMIPGIHIELPSHTHPYGSYHNDQMVFKERKLSNNFKAVMKGRDRIHT